MLWYFFVLILIGLLAYRLVAEVIDRDITPLEFTGYTAALLLATVLMIRHIGDPIGPSLALTILAFGLLHGAVGYLINQSHLAAMRAQDMREAERMTRERPELPFPYRTMGDLLMEQGLIDEAVGFYKRALSLHDDPEVKFRLKQCEQIARRKQQDLTVCPECLMEIPRTARECPECGHFMGLGLQWAAPRSLRPWLVRGAIVLGVIAAVGGGVLLSGMRWWLAPVPALVLIAALAGRALALRRASR